MSVKTVRRVFISVLIFLPLQYIAVGIIGYYEAEPWPAFVFPGFKNVYATDDYYQIHQTKFDVYNAEDEKIASLEPHLFFSDLPRSQIAGLMRSAFHDANTIENFSPEAKQLLYKNSRRFTDQNVHRLDVVYNIHFMKSGADGLEADSVEQQLIGMIEFED